MSARSAEIEAWLAGLEARHLADLTFPEVRRGLVALSSLYVERRGGSLVGGAALHGAGKRAAFALFYGPMHFLLIRAIVGALGMAEGPRRRIVDLGCGTGAAGAAWALEGDAGDRPEVRGIDRNPWAVKEARWTYRALGLRGEARGLDLDRARLGPEDVLAAFAVNELDQALRSRLLARMLDASRLGSHVLVVEPISRAAAPWWGEWSAAFASAGGTAHEWRFPAELPPLLEKLDRAAGLDHREITGRSLSLTRLPPGSSKSPRRSAAAPSPLGTLPIPTTPSRVP